MNKNKIKINKITLALISGSVLAPTISVLTPATAMAQNVSIGQINNQNADETIVTVNNSELVVKYKSNLNTDIKKFLIPASGKIVIDFFGVVSSDSKEQLLTDSIIEKYQTIYDGQRTRLILTVKQALIDELKNNKSPLSIDDIIISQSPNETKLAFKSHLLFLAQKVKEKNVTQLIEEKKTLVDKQNNQNTYIENITDELNAARQAQQKIDTQLKSNVMVNQKIVLEKLNFSKISNATGRLVLDLSRGDNFAQVKKADNYLIIEIPGMVASDELMKKIQTSDFNLATKSIDVLRNDSGTKIILEQNGFWEHSMSQTDRKVILDIKSLTKEQSDKIKEEEFKKSNTSSGKKLTLNFQNMDVRALLQVVADFTNLNIVASDKVVGNMTVKLNNVPWEQALEVILDSKDLTMQQKGNVIWVATREEFNNKQKNMLESQSQTYELEELKLVTFQLNYHKAADVATFLIGGKTVASSAGAAGQGVGISAKTESGDNRILSKRGSVNFDARTNTLFIQDTDKKIEEISRIIKKLDASSRQVLIEAKLVIADQGWTRDLGVKYGFQYNQMNRGNGIGVASTSANATQQINGQTVTVDSTTGFRAITNPANAVDFGAATGAATLGISFLNQLTGIGLTAELSAMENNNLGKVISNPKIVTFDHQAAKIKQGTEIPYVTPGSASSPATISFREAVLELNVKPQISPNGRVNLELNIKKDTVGELLNVGGATNFSINKKEISTQVTVKNGQTIVLGGVYESISRDDVKKIPFLGDVPGLGHFFKNTIKENGKAEFLVFITPHVIEDTLLDQAPQAEIMNIKTIK